ncbi:MAG TPA: alpha/beta fold hydrolase [Anaerolineae bacterium]|nr:alpha/beta fold hydrolase [Anaerolineae bacterium]
MRLATHRIPGLVLTDHEFSLPLDHARPGGERIAVFAREVVAPGKENADLPWLVFFQGGPGFGSPRPEGNSGWLKRATQEYRVLLLDQRGTTARSASISHQTLARPGTPQAQADYLKHFRADSIVQDAESIRRELIGADKQWSVLGQSYGGFCVVHYLSAAPGGLKEALITGGLPPLNRPVDDIYRATYRRAIEKNRLYYERYPEDVERVRDIVEFLQAHDVRLPDGDRLSTRRFQQLGFRFGMSNGFEQVHYLIDEAFVLGTAGRELSYAFLRGVDTFHAFDTNPIYAILHEAEYCQAGASNWSAERVRAEYPEFSLSPDRPAFFTGEMVYPWMFDEYSRLRPLKQAADILARYEGWPRLYDQAALRQNSVSCAAAIYANDMYVERTYSEETAQAIRGIRVWLTNEYEHNGLRAEGEKILGRLLAMLRGEE